MTEDIDSGEIKKYRPSDIEQAVLDLSKANVLIGHNIIGYDLPVLKKLFDLNYQGKILDTLLLSRLSQPNRAMHPRCPVKVWDEHNNKFKLVGPHTLMNLGHYAGAIKGDFGESAGWEHYSEEMLDYCVQDVKVTTQVFHYLMRELHGFSDECILLEHQFAEAINQQMYDGWYFDIEGAYKLEAELMVKVLELEDEVHKTFKPLAKEVRVIQPKVLKAGGLSSVGLKFLEGYETDIPTPSYIEGQFGKEYLSGAFTRIEWPEFNLGSRSQIADQLLHRGWKPKQFTENGNIIVNEKVLEGIKGKFKEATLLADYFMVSKKRSMVKSWIDNWNEDTQRIHGYVNTLGAATRRCTHSGPNLAQVPASKQDKEGNLIFGFEGQYGADCRSLFTVPKGYKQVGCDASGLNLNLTPLNSLNSGEVLASNVEDNPELRNSTYEFKVQRLSRKGVHYKLMVVEAESL